LKPWPIEIVDLPIENGGSFHSYGTVYQRVTLTLDRFVPQNHIEVSYNGVLPLFLDTPIYGA